MKVMDFGQLLKLAIVTPFLSISVTFPLYLMIREQTIAQHTHYLAKERAVIRGEPKRLSLTELLDA